jgi:hypothetical protein
MHDPGPNWGPTRLISLLDAKFAYRQLQLVGSFTSALQGFCTPSSVNTRLVGADRMKGWHPGNWQENMENLRPYQKIFQEQDGTNFHRREA